MPNTTTSLGGRLAVAVRSSLNGAQLELFDRYVPEALPWAERAGFVMQSADGSLLGALGPSLQSPEISARFLDYLVAEERYTTLSGRERQVVILAVGAIWRSAHWAASRTAGLTPEQLETLAGGGMPEGLSTSEQCAWRFARQITAERNIDQSLYDDVVGSFGAHGITDMLHLIGAYQTVCGLLNAFDVPVPEGV